ncbi:MAG: FlgD immunoglobulin-like domain containing protein, partial [Candidatus Peregrinibacteria bacterium]
PYTVLEYGSKYNVKVPKETVYSQLPNLPNAPKTYRTADVTWSFTTKAQQAAPPICTEGQINPANASQKCVNGAWVAITPPCTEGQINAAGTQKCVNGVWVQVTSSSSGSSSSSSSSSSGSSSSSSSGSQPTTPPSAATEIKITSASAYPTGFNPLTDTTTITFKISARAKIELKITDDRGVTITTLGEETLSADQYELEWDGTNSAGTVVDPGTYYFKILAKDPTSSELKDSKTGVINIIYQNAQSTDFENTSTSASTATTTPTSNPTTTTTTTPVFNAPTTNSQAMVSLSNATTGVTAETGPSVLLYALLPLTSFLFKRRKK